MKSSKYTEVSLWRELRQCYKVYIRSGAEFGAATKTFLQADIDRIPLLRNALRGAGDDRDVVLSIAPKLPQSDLMELLPELVELASTTHGLIDLVRQIILSLPHLWVIEHINKYTEPLLQKGTDEEYRRLLELYVLLDKNLSIELAQRAAAQSNIHIVEVGNDYLEMLNHYD